MDTNNLNKCKLNVGILFAVLDVVDSDMITIIQTDTIQFNTQSLTFGYHNHIYLSFYFC